jgi:hypothetical protein
MEFRKVSRKKAKIKMSVSAPTGFGKTTSALLIAKGITGDWTKVAVIDSENGSADLYEQLGDYNVVSMKPPFSVDNFCTAVDLCIKNGAEVIIPDSIYHYWHGKGGVLDYVGSLGGKFQDWAKGSPMWQKLLDKILQTDAHFICTTRKKQAYEIVQGSNGKKEVEKKGMEDQVRDGFDYEMTLALDIISANHLCKANKDRTGLFMGKPEFVVTEETGKAIKEWCESGKEAAKELPQIAEKAFGQAIEKFKAGDKEVFGKVRAAFTLTEEQNNILNSFESGAAV